MPYSGISKEDTPKMERCVQDVMAKGKDKDRAIAICHSAIAGSSSLLNFQAATEEDILSLQASMDDVPTNEILKFVGACLAKAEINLNQDGITDEGIQQLASTIRLMPITNEHDRKKPIGVFTRGYTNEDSTECLVDGFIWSGHFPAEAKEIKNGTRKLSMDAEAELAVCSLCGTAFDTTLDYCEHMRNRTRGAVRWLYDLKSVAGGAVMHPAGTGTLFPGREGFVVISHKLEQPVIEKPQKPRKPISTGGKTMKVVCSECGHEQEIATEAEKVQAELDAKLEELQSLQAEAQEAQARIEELEGEKARAEAEVQTEKKVIERFSELAGKAGIEFATEALPSLRKADDDTFKTFVAMASRIGEQREESPTPPQPPETVVASEGDPPPVEDTWSMEV